ncbi:RNA 2'-O ribose methyltransferase substrate binding family protein, partial [Chlamydia psittaci C1/97]
CYEETVVVSRRVFSSEEKSSTVLFDYRTG